jgi:glycosyltransferase involved in cell wall biosynthesis
MLDGLPSDRLKLHPIGELASLLRSKLGDAGAEAVLHRRNDRFQRSIPDADLAGSDVVVGFDTSSWLIAARVRSLGRKFILDRSIGHPLAKERIFTDLRERYPAWVSTVPKKAADHIAEEEDEHRLADLIVVPSAFVGKTLTSQGVPDAKIRVVPFGTDLSMFKPSDARRPVGRVIFLFVGSLSARKGVPTLLEAWRAAAMVDAELWLVGSGALPESEIADLPSGVRLLGPQSRDQVAALMRAADIFVFPSFFEGLAQVQIEALASGLPVIGTRESGAEEIVRDDHNGFVIAAGNAAVLADRMKQLEGRPPELARLRGTVLAERPRLGWSIYGDRWSQLLDELR